MPRWNKVDKETSNLVLGLLQRQLNHNHNGETLTTREILELLANWIKKNDTDLSSAEWAMRAKKAQI